MLNLFIAPRNYISGYDILKNIGNEISKISREATVLYDKNIEDIIVFGINSLKNKLNIKIEYFNGDCTHKEIDRVVKVIKENKSDCIIGFGGGKTMDTVKAAGYKADVKIVTVPTIAATCASWASHSAVYSDTGASYEYFNIYKNPDILYMDKKIIFEAPKRYIISGIQDTLAKWIETNAYTKNIKNKNVELEIAIYLAKKAYNEILKYGKKVIKDIENKNYSEEVDRIIEHIILTAGLIGGIGGEACRAVAAHAINNGFTIFPEYRENNLHGEVVGFGNIVQLVLDKEYDMLDEILEFYHSINAPIGIKGLGYDLDDDKLKRVINKAMYKGDTIWNSPYKVDFEMIKNAILEAEELCSKYYIK
ncbi:glycerol 2-dehydrogenase (NAD+) [Hypnocyclicus thermotrophus]|uniref:Glycerol 2-dehydrogenase (NAD+) n=1 Tax=Hypnocyclicus thermotrophus TaxID=1627895 RepID=A0AA46DYG9_9FUSO|nr:iron-containing alcohol dehydrogenase family protein [Hypnocyclicus thermotrophus]TDT69737.1 glycerol 2-dehydrogenase (NAD+) [Hypnocyclicus thermotrophus]